jgi:hypothetical protein
MRGVTESKAQHFSTSGSPGAGGQLQQGQLGPAPSEPVQGLNAVEGCGRAARKSIAPTKAITSDDLRRLNHKRKRALVVGIALGAALLVVGDSSWRSEWPGLHRAIQWTDLMLIGVCMAHVVHALYIARFSTFACSCAPCH